MDLGSSLWKETIIAGARELGIQVHPDQAELFARHAHILVEWNQKMNLTTIVDPLEMGIKHFLDAILPMAHIQPHSRLLDVGSGAGFPGIALKIMLPTLQVTLVEATRKKVSFLKHVIRELGLNQIEAIHSRIENLDRRRTGEFDVIVSRAFSDLPTFIKLTLPYLTGNGQLIAYKAKGYETEIPDIHEIFNRQAGQQETSWPAAGVRIKMLPFTLPGLCIPRNLVLLRFQNRVLEI